MSTTETEGPETEGPEATVPAATGSAALSEAQPRPPGAAPEAHGPGSPPDLHVEHEHAHPTDATYIWVAVFLAVVTGAEIAVSYTKWFEDHFPALLITLVVMMVVKFATVAMFFMHLRFDSKLFRRFFVTGIVLATSVYLVVLSTFHFFDH
jgi:cytochrome c oxidase subunit IV